MLHLVIRPCHEDLFEIGPDGTLTAVCGNFEYLHAYIKIYD